MTASVVRWLVVVGAILALPAAGSAQEATLGGTVTDSTGGVLPGVTVSALHQATGNRFEGVTGERGTFVDPWVIVALVAAGSSRPEISSVKFEEPGQRPFTDRQTRRAEPEARRVF